LTSLSFELPLTGVRVVDLSDRLAGAYCTKLLVDLGADVVKVEPPAGDPLRQRKSPVPGSSAAPGALFQYLCASKRSTTLDLETADGRHSLRRLAQGADLVLETWIPGTAERMGLSAAELLDLNSTLTVVSVSAFGRGGPRSEKDVPEFLLQALSGATYSRGRPGRSPLTAAGGLSEWIAGAFAATAGAAALMGSAMTGRGSHVDVSILEAATLGLVTAPVIAESLRGYPTRVSARRVVPGIQRCSDGWVGLFVLTPQQWYDFTVMIERPELAEDPQLVSLFERQERDEELVPLIEQWTSKRTVADVLSLAKLLRIPAAPVGNGKSLPEFEAIADRGIYVDNPGGFRQPRSMFSFDGVPFRPIGKAPALGEHNESLSIWPVRRHAAADGSAMNREALVSRPLKGIRVVDLTAFWAGPLATGILSALGAEVIKIESVQHPDPLRFTGFLPASKPQWYEAAPLFNALNLDKRSLTLDLGSEEGQSLLLKFVASADVVIENFTPRVLENFNLNYKRFAEARPDIILARMPAFGLEGPWRDRPGFAPTLEQISGLAWINGYEDTEPIAPNGFVDPAAGAHAAFAIVSALIARRNTGHGHEVELPMVEVATSVTAEQVIEYDLTGQVQGRHGNADLFATPQGVYDCLGESEDNWVAISTQTDSQWTALADIVGADKWTEPSLDQLATAETRWNHREAIDARLRVWCAARTNSDIVEILDNAEVPAAPVVHDHLIVDDQQMRARGFWQKLSHPVIGDQWYAGFPFLREGKEWYERPSPLLGQDNDQILRSIGFSVEEIRDMERRQVIGHVPLGL
jgi:crotonobetainyl-CoA:carnitine CoA-transferase CaiB-like acyl-CoA transferase